MQYKHYSLHHINKYTTRTHSSVYITDKHENTGRH